jgi:CHAD domain-containing protein
VLQIRTRRRPYALQLAGATVGEVALDDTAIAMGSGQSPARIRRVEVEVVPDFVEAMEPLVDQLRRDCGLQPATLSKFEAGLLAAGLPMPAAPDLGPMIVHPGSTVGEVAFAVLRRNVIAMLSHEPGTRLGEDIEDLHDMRVATRRLRAALSLFVQVLPVRARPLRDELGWLAGMLGAVRDLDVHRERVATWLGQVPEADRAPLGELQELLVRQREDARRQLLTCLDSTRYDKLVAGLTAMLIAGPSRRSSAARLPATATVPDLIFQRHRSATKAARRARRSGLPEDFHRLRIRCKRLRYALEFVSEVYRGQTGSFVREVVRLQDGLGLMQDAEVAVTRLRSLATTTSPALSPATVFAMGEVAERYGEEARHLLRELPSRVKVLDKGQWQKLATLLERRRASTAIVDVWSMVPARRTSPGTAVAMPSGPNRDEGASASPAEQRSGATVHVPSNGSHNGTDPADSP